MTGTVVTMTKRTRDGHLATPAGSLTGPAGRRHRLNLAALIAAGGALAYTISKIDLAIRAELGMPGFPAPPSSYVGFEDVTGAQLGNASVGLVAAALALVLLVPMRRGAPRILTHIVNWAGFVMPAAGVVGFGIRALQLTDALGPVPPNPMAAALTLAVGALWATGWAFAILRHPIRLPENVTPA